MARNKPRAPGASPAQPQKPATSRPPAPRATGTAAWNPLLVYLALLAGLLLAYGPALDGAMIWDDDYHLPKREWRSFEGLLKIWFVPTTTPQYYPLTYTGLWIQHHVWNGGTVGVHVVNVAVHALGATLLWRVLLRLAVPGALFGAALWAFHPLQVESVAWMSELKNTLSGVFFFLTLLLWLRFARPQNAEESERRWGTWFLALSCFTCALLSKGVTAVWPGVALTVLWLHDGKLSWRRDILPCLPFFALAIGAGVLSWWMEQHSVGAKTEETGLLFAERFVLAGRALCFYAAKIVWPAGLLFSYERWDVTAASWRDWIWPSVVVIAIVVCWLLRTRVGRGPLAAVLVFCGALFPALGFVDVFPFQYSYVADHFQYLAGAALIAALAAGATLLAREYFAQKHLAGRITVARAAAGALLAILAALSWSHSRIYEDMETLWRSVIARNPTSWFANTNLGVELRNQGRNAEAIACYEAALSADPDNDKALFNLGNVLDEVGRRDEAIAAYRRAIEAKPLAFEYYNNLGNALDARGDSDEAIECFRTAVRIKPEFATAHQNLGSTLARRGDLEEAIVHHKLAIDAAPTYTAPYNSLGIALARLGRTQEALPWFERAIAMQLHYPEAHNNYAMALFQGGDLERAEKHLRIALQQRPNYPNARENLERVLAQKRKAAGGQ